MISNGFMYWIFFALCKLLYGVIPGLYDAFEFFGTYQFFDLDKDIKTIWGNLYVLLSVLVLFAIAIKLINAIVNPDVLDDKKNGVKKVFIRAFVAVFLTVLTPYIFTLLVDVQENIFTNKTIDKIFFNASGNQNTGHVIAWTAITSFINLDELAKETATTNHAYNLDTSAVSEGSTSNSHIYILSEDVDTGLNNIYKSQPWNYVDTVPQNPILMLLAGAFIVYEFILLVMDTALRSIKLGILQMMTPVILGAYIFKEDILKKWALEYIKTFVQIFLLLISISLMTKVLSLLPNIMAGPNWPNNPSWLLIGIINTLAIMATLRLVHQIIPLINKIFGTNIEGKGGIRGRLGEMAVVGGLAQRAWDTFRQHPIQTTRKLAAAPISAVGGAVAHSVAAGKAAGFGGIGKNIRDNLAHGGWRHASNWAALHRANRTTFRDDIGLKGIGTLGAGLLTSVGAGARGARQGWQYGNIRAIGAQGRRYEETHRADSTFLGRMGDDLRETVGIESREAVFARNAERVSKARNALNSARQSATQLFNSEHSSMGYNSAITSALRAAGMDAADAASVEGMFVGHTAYQIRQMIDEQRQAAPTRENFTSMRYDSATGNIIKSFDKDAYDDAVKLHNEKLQNMELALRTFTNSGVTEILNEASSLRGDLTQFVDGTVEGKELASITGNNVTEQRGIYGANMKQEQIGWKEPTNLEKIGDGTFGTQFDDLVTGNDKLLREFTEFYDASGKATARGKASADQKSRDSRYTDNAKPNHGGGNNGS